jgi:hypothetical protein
MTTRKRAALTPAQRRHLEAIRDGMISGQSHTSTLEQLHDRRLWIWLFGERVLTDAGRAALREAKP